MATALIANRQAHKSVCVLPLIFRQHAVHDVVSVESVFGCCSARTFSSAVNSIAVSPIPSHAASKPFVNLGERYWHVQRRKWLSGDRTPRSSRHRRLKAVAVELTRFESLLRNPDRRITLPHAIPLGQMVDILVELWEDDGMFR